MARINRTNFTFYDDEVDAFKDKIITEIFTPLYSRQISPSFGTTITVDIFQQQEIDKYLLRELSQVIDIESLDVKFNNGTVTVNIKDKNNSKIYFSFSTGE